MQKVLLLAIVAYLVLLQPAAAMGAPRPPLGLAASRKLLQWGRASQQIAAARVSRQATQAQIRAAVDNPYPSTQFGATQAATDVGQVGATLTTVDPCSLAWTYDCWNNYRWGGGGRRWGGRN
ncbi:MAG: hypothetical protein J3K34DRAFT_402630 [Monoraphidium minutum]|nr:MAG: hypothetical protein J3K34DRAFT_402630 [Monoraphidium minutum]